MHFFKSIRWQWSKWLLGSMLLFNFLLLFSGLAWILMKFDLPFLHSGDKHYAYISIFIWWISASILIWGWRSDENR